MTKLSYKHLDRIQRDTIEHLISKKYSLTAIGNAISKDRTTISKEIIRNRYAKYTDSNENTSKCKKLDKVPYVCNPCPDKHICYKKKLYYNAKVADDNYSNKLKTSREGVDISAEEIEQIESVITPLIKDKKQSVNQVYANHSDILYFSKTTFYTYVDQGVLSLCNLDLPKKVKYKPRKKKRGSRNRRNLALLKNRTYDDYTEYVTKHHNMSVVQTDTVEGTLTSSKVLLTLLILKTDFMLMFLLDKQNMACVDKAMANMKSNLGISLYSKVFRIVLTDNGPEFFNPLMFELDYKNDRKVSNLFYCDPYCSYQKGALENNHRYIRKVFPKGTSFDEIDVQTIKKLEDHINNTPREILDNKTPYELTKELYPDLLEKLNCSYIEPDEVTFNIDDYIN